MTIDIASIFKAIGPAASVIFAAWIFLGFLQTRFDAAIDRYRALVGRYRDQRDPEDRRSNLRDSILAYKRRCEIMNVATIIGLASAIILILTLMAGELAMIYTKVDALKLLSATGAFIGLLLVIVASGIVLYESLIIRRQLEAELLDVPELAHGIGQEAGKISDQKRAGPRGV